MLMDLARVLNKSVEMLRSNNDHFCHDEEVSRMTRFMIGEGVDSGTIYFSVSGHRNNCGPRDQQFLSDSTVWCDRTVQ
jgi:hypothetical protein